jgi:hypothetical protein
MEYPEDVIKRFWSKVQVCEHGNACRDCCWLWQGSCAHSKLALPYGRFWPRPRQKIFAHRFMWTITIGAIPGGMVVLHNCPQGDNPSCVNPAHLFLGTHLMNMADMRAKGRAHKRKTQGASNRNTHLCDDDIYAIRCAIDALVTRYGVSPSTIRSIAERRHWNHLPEQEEA